MSVPIINVDGEVPDRHAARIVVQMTRWLDAESIRICDTVEAHRHMFECGSPVAQERYAGRMKKAFGHLVLDQHLKTGKRGKYRLDTHIWVPAPPSLGRHCIGGIMLTIDSAGGWRRECVEGKWKRRQNRDCSEVPTFLVSAHALQRTAQRSGVKTPFDLLSRLRAIGKVVLDAELLRTGGTLDGLRDNRAALHAGTWRLPFDGGVAVCKRDFDEDVPIVVTVLPL
jgi:hypothetical protein